MTHSNSTTYRNGTRTMSRLILGVLFVALACSPALASGAKLNTMTGTWEISATLYGKPAVALVTFHADGTLVATPPSASNVNAHGVWEKRGARTFVEKNREYLHDKDGNFVFVADTREVIYLSEDGLTYTTDSVTEIKLLDGTVVNTVTYETTGRRLVLDF